MSVNDAIGLFERKANSIQAVRKVTAREVHSIEVITTLPRGADLETEEAVYEAEVAVMDAYPDLLFDFQVRYE